MRLSPKAQASLNQVVEKFKSGDLSPIAEITRLERKGDPLPFDTWSFSNRIIAFCQTGSTDLRGYRQWQKAGRQVVQGSKAAFILAPCTRKIDDEKDEKKVVVIGFKAIPVFALENTEGDPVPQHDYNPPQLPPLVDVAQRLGVKASWQPLPPDRLGDCDKSGENIRMATHDQAVFFHELAHAAHAKLDGQLKSGQRTEQEAIADFTACVLMNMYGLGDRTGNTWHYIQHYHKDPLTAITKALSKVEQVLTLLLEDTTNVS